MDAILVTRENVSDISVNLVDMPAQRILDVCDFLLNASINVVLVRDSIGDMFIESGILSESLFHSWYTNDAPLNDKTFVPVIRL